MCLIVLSVFVCFLFQIGVCSLELLWLTVDCSLVYFVIKLRAPFYRTPFSWEDPAAWVRSFTQNNCTCFCSGPSRPVVCWAVIELISQVRVVGPQRSCTFGPTSQELRFWFLLWRLKKKKSKPPVEADISLDISSCWRTWFSLSTLALRLQATRSWLLQSVSAPTPYLVPPHSLIPDPSGHIDRPPVGHAQFSLLPPPPTHKPQSHQLHHWRFMRSLSKS